MERSDYQFYEHLDSVLRSIKNSTDLISLAKVLGKNNATSDKDYQINIANKLENDGLIRTVRDFISIDVIMQSAGNDFISQGGYLEQIKQKEEKEKSDKELVETSISSNRANVRMYKWNVAMIIINVLTIVINLLIVYFNYHSK